jgi:23S rRNA (uracil1939-C5)-methyltransferase
LSGVAVVGHSQSWRHGNLTLRYDHGRADAYTLWFEPDLFTQAYPQMNDALVAAVLRALSPAPGMRVLEFHAGLGNFTVPLVLAGASVTAVEQNRRSAILGRRNLAAAGVNAMLLERADHDALGLVSESDRVLLDPPRTGAKQLAETLAQRGPERLVYVSCDPATLARDARTLAEGGYQIKSLELFDMFPETPHVESLLVMQRS